LIDNISIAIASCLNNPERKEYLLRTIESLKTFLGDVEILVAFDKYGIDIKDIKCYTHNRGLGHSFNWGIMNASNPYILQMEDDWIINEQINKEEIIYDLNKQIEVINKNGGIFKLDFPPLVKENKWDSGYKDLKELDYVFFELKKSSSEIKWFLDYNSYFYSNHPHLKKKSIVESVGLFSENVPPPEVEIYMCKKYHESKERIFFIKKDIFIHIGEVRSRD